jgi:hypothetical protein
MEISAPPFIPVSSKNARAAMKAYVLVMLGASLHLKVKVSDLFIWTLSYRQNALHHAIPCYLVIAVAPF